MDRNQLSVALGRRFARLATDVVVRQPALWRLFRGPLRRQFDRLPPPLGAARGPRPPPAVGAWRARGAPPPPPAPPLRGRRVRARRAREHDPLLRRAGARRGSRWLRRPRVLRWERDADLRRLTAPAGRARPSRLRWLLRVDRRPGHRLSCPEGRGPLRFTDANVRGAVAPARTLGWSEIERSRSNFWRLHFPPGRGSSVGRAHG